MITPKIKAVEAAQNIRNTLHIRRLSRSNNEDEKSELMFLLRRVPGHDVNLRDMMSPVAM
jgi:hypothetical protein